MDRSAGPAVKAQRLHDGECCGGDEHLDGRSGQHTLYFAMMGAAAFCDGVEVGLDSGPGVLPYPELSSCRSSMIRTKGPADAASSDSILSTMAWPLNSGAAGRDSAPPVAAGPRPAARVRRAARRAGPAVRA